MTKNEWRKRVAELKKEMLKEEWEEFSYKIRDQLFNLPEWKESSHICLYYSVEKEVDTLSIAKQAWREGKKIYFPKCNPNEKKLTFYQVEHLSSLTKIYYGIPEPDPECCDELLLSKLDMIIIPGLVFDQKGYRIGYGGGYYDRFLPKIHSKVHKIALAFDYQVIRDTYLPIEEHDLPVHQIITNSAVLRMQNK